MGATKAEHMPGEKERSSFIDSAVIGAAWAGQRGN